jgi:hypothetical protein
MIERVISGVQTGADRAVCGDATCDYHDDHDEDDRPRGNRCGKPATRTIFWKDGRWSMGCDEHVAEVSREVPELIKAIR